MCRYRRGTGASRIQVTRDPIGPSRGLQRVRGASSNGFVPWQRHASTAENSRYLSRTVHDVWRPTGCPLQECTSHRQGGSPLAPAHSHVRQEVESKNLTIEIPIAR